MFLFFECSSKAFAAEVTRVEVELGASVVALVTDNASNMALARSRAALLAPFQYGCQCHILHLLVGDLFKDANRNRILGQVPTILCATLSLKFPHLGDIHSQGFQEHSRPCQLSQASQAAPASFAL